MSNIIDKLAWIHIQGDRLLAARTRNNTAFYVPGGKREDGETDHAALIREVKEELSIELDPMTIKPAGTFCAQAHGESGNVQVQLHCFFADFEGEIKPTAEIAECQYLAYQDAHSCSAATVLVMQWLFEQGLIN